MSDTMKALVKAKPEKGLWLEEVPIPEIGINDVLIKIKRTSVCGTDMHIYNWDSWAEKTIPVPMHIGHEFVGEVADMGSNVHDLEIGDIVSGEGHLVCGRCRNCMAGRRHLCAHTKGVGVNREGAFAEYLSIPVTNVWHADPNIPLDILSSFDPLGNATHNGSLLPGTRRGCAHHRRRSDRTHGRRNCASRWSPTRCHHGHEPLPA